MDLEAGILIQEIEQRLAKLKDILHAKQLTETKLDTVKSWYNIVSGGGVLRFYVGTSSQEWQVFQINDQAPSAENLEKLVLDLSADRNQRAKISLRSYTRVLVPEVTDFFEKQKSLVQSVRFGNQSVLAHWTLLQSKGFVDFRTGFINQNNPNAVNSDLMTLVLEI